MSADPAVPTKENPIPMAVKARRLVLFDRARVALGGADRLGAALGISRRSVNHKLAVERGLSDANLRDAADAVEAQAGWLTALARDLREQAGG